ncbi:MAG: CorA family divalent cation transporter [Pseudomonadota bacterium]
MRIARKNGDGEIEISLLDALSEPPDDALWIDLHGAHPGAIEAVEKLTGVVLPTQAQMAEIEVSNRLRESHGALVMTCVLLSEQDSDRPISRAATFVLTRKRLITIRHSSPKAFDAFAAQLAEDAGWRTTPEMMLCGLWQAIIARTADVIERLSGEVEKLNETVLRPANARRPVSPEAFRIALRRVAAANDLTQRIQESLFSLSRLMSYPEQAAPDRFSPDFRAVAHRLRRDAAALSQHTEFLSGKIAFQLDAVLGLISVEQNAIIRILSVAATVFLPPTLIASLYGMNFEFMPELAWPHGYPMALGLMALSAAAPLLLFKWRGWL